LALVLLAGCVPVAKGGGPLVLQDDAGREVRLEAPARRVASLIPAATEWLFALGGGAWVVGRTEWCDYPAAASAVPSLGDGIMPNVEAIVSAAPDLTLLYDSPANLNAADRLTALGMPVLLLRTDGLADLDRQLALLGRAIGREHAADSLRAAIRERLEAVSVPLREGAPSVLIIAWDQPPITLGQGSFLSEVLERAGGRNLFGDISAASASISIEVVVARDPDLVLVTGADSLPAFARRPEWAVVPAVRDRRFLRVQGSEFNRPGPRTPDAILELRGALERRAP
jgi:ABC-type Fe3+-hydroxamate transport system substrate-binding protein